MPQLVYCDRHFPLGDDEMILGRHADCSIYVRDGRASRKNSRIFKGTDGNWIVEDLDSANGTRVNGQEIFSPRPLINGDIISIGKDRIWFIVEVPDTNPSPSDPGTEVISKLPTEHQDPLIGTTCGSCRILSAIGTGFTGNTYRAEILSTGRSAAFRLYHAHFAERDALFPERMIEAIRAAARVTSPDAIQILDCGIEGQRPWYAMELLDGQSLEEKIARDGRFELTQALDCLLTIAQMLATCHAQNLNHLSLSPASVFIDTNGRIRIADIGLSAALIGATHRRHAVPNPWHSAPERLAGSIGDHRSDIYSLGCIFYHLLMGESPLASGEAQSASHAPAVDLKTSGGSNTQVPSDIPLPTLCDKRPGMPIRVDEILAGTLARSPEWRYQSVDELIADLKQLKDNPTQASSKPRKSGFNKGPSSSRSSATELVAPVPRRSTVKRKQSSTTMVLSVLLIGAIGALVYNFVSQSPSLEKAATAAANVTASRHPNVIPSTTPSDSSRNSSPPENSKLQPDIIQNDGTIINELAFAGPEDLQSLEVLQGEPQLHDHGLTSSPGTACGISDVTIISGDTWQSELDIEATPHGTLPPQVAVSFQADDNKPTILLRITPQSRMARMLTSLGTEQFHIDAAAPGTMRIRFECKQGNLTITDRNDIIAMVKDLILPPNTRIHISISGMDWKISRIKTVTSP